MLSDRKLKITSAFRKKCQNNLKLDDNDDEREIFSLTRMKTSVKLAFFLSSRFCISTATKSREIIIKYLTYAT